MVGSKNWEKGLGIAGTQGAESKGSKCTWATSFFFGASAVEIEKILYSWLEFIDRCPPFQLKTDFLLNLPRCVINFRQTNFLSPCVLSSDGRKTCVLHLQLYFIRSSCCFRRILDSLGHDSRAAAGIVGSSVDHSISATLSSSCLDAIGASKY